LFFELPFCDEALQGPATFSQHASAIAPSIQSLRDQPKSQGIFLHRLMFVVRYAHFHQLLERQDLQDAASDLVAIFQEDLAPKSWWAVLLCDSVQLSQYGM
jgi:nuclear pore complex protein Nup85